MKIHGGAIEKVLVTPSLKHPWIGDEKTKLFRKFHYSHEFGNLAMLSIESEIAKSIDFENVLQKFANKKLKEFFSKRTCLQLHFL